MSEPIIIFEDDNILVINKPFGMTVNNADSVKDVDTVQNWAEKRLGISGKQFDPLMVDGYDVAEEFKNRGGVVHRLDKETSGILVIAKNPQAFSYMKNQFMTRTTNKRYVALVHGKISPEKGTIDAPTGRLPYNRTHFGVIAGGREAITEYTVTGNYALVNSKRKEILSLVELEPKTGRTHQIRVHLKHIGHPIFGDELYAGRKTARDDRRLLPRLFLHAKSLTFQNPNGEMQTIEAPLPEELERFLDMLKNNT